MCIILVSIYSCKCLSRDGHAVAEEFEIVLDGEGDGGFQWYYKEIPEVIKVDSTIITISEEGKLNRYQKKFILKGVEKGNYELEFYQQQSFNILDTIPEEYIKRIKVKIKK